MISSAAYDEETRFASPLKIRAGIVAKEKRRIDADVKKLISFVREKFK